MPQFSPLRTAIILIAAIAGALFTLPNLLSTQTLDALPGWLPKQQMVLGLDLQGGSHLLMQVNRQEIIDERIADLRRDARSILANERGIGNIITTNGMVLTIELTNPAQLEEARQALQPLTAGVATLLLGIGSVQDVVLGTTADGKLTLTLTGEGITALMSTIVAQSIEVVRRRIDELGTTEPSIQRQGADRILVQVPGFEDSARLKDVISRTARMTFHLVHPTMTAAQARAQGLPTGTEIVPAAEGGEELIFEESQVGGEDLQDAQASFDSQRSQWVVTFRFNTRGGITFGEITSQNVRRRFAIILDGTVITAPEILSPITGGSGQIQGSFTAESATDLAVLLRAGALPATLDIIEERSVGPSLGADSIKSGLLAGIVAAAAVILFMIAAYGLFGVFANVSLILNVVLLLAALSVLGATLTLPGIAGVVLTLGMAVDANVLIYERTREELASGRSILQAINVGFQRAWATIVDSNLTALIAAAVLFFMGSGPIQGFAVTLALGLVISMFTAYTVTLFIIGIWYRIRRPKKLKIQVFRFVPDNTKIPFMKLARYAIVFSIVTSALSIGWVFVQGFNLGIDFKGGSAIEVQHIGGPADPGAIRERLNALGLGDVQVQGFGTPEDVLIRIEQQVGGDAAQQAAVDKVRDALASENYEVRRTETVGPAVSGELATTGTIAFAVAMLGIMAYIWFRFEWQFAIGAIIATLHDVILTVGLFAFTGMEFNLTSIAAVLTVVGLSVNDTVVIYDRVRENLRKYKKMPLSELIDLSINSTLARTTLTAFTTFLALIPLVLFGGEVIRGFTVAMTWGVFVGTYSSIVIAAPVLIYFKLTARADKAKEDRRADGASV
ncbi:MAG: protein translocase subunit SecD [Cucumibacter sp.]